MAQSTRPARIAATRPASQPIIFNPTTQSATDPIPFLQFVHGKPSGWELRHEQFLARGKQGDVNLVFFGDSITEFWQTKSDFDHRYADCGAAGFGISGDRTQWMLWRIQNGEMANIHPKVAVVLIGTNNLSANSPNDVAAAIGEIVTTIRTASPTTKVLVIGILPRDIGKPDKWKWKVGPTNALLARLDDHANVRVMDLSRQFENADGSLNTDLFKDRLHPNDRGYGVLAGAINPVIREMGADVPAGADSPVSTTAPASAPAPASSP